jgi:hypothetical protein
MNKEDILGFLVFFGVLIIPPIDETYITSKIKEQELASRVQCHDFPDKCWIQIKKRSS